MGPWNAPYTLSLLEEDTCCKGISSPLEYPTILCPHLNYALAEYATSTPRNPKIDA